MDPWRELGKMLLLFGGMLVLVGLLLTIGSRLGGLPLRLGRLPGDIVYHGEGTTFYFPIITCLLLSAVVSAVIWLVEQIKR